MSVVTAEELDPFFQIAGIELADQQFWDLKANLEDVDWQALYRENTIEACAELLSRVLIATIYATYNAGAGAIAVVLQARLIGAPEPDPELLTSAIERYERDLSTFQFEDPLAYARILAIYIAQALRRNM